MVAKLNKQQQQLRNQEEIQWNALECTAAVAASSYSPSLYYILYIAAVAAPGPRLYTCTLSLLCTIAAVAAPGSRLYTCISSHVYVFAQWRHVHPLCLCRTCSTKCWRITGISSSFTGHCPQRTSNLVLGSKKSLQLGFNSL